jgi:deoxycytidylate deaminase
MTAKRYTVTACTFDKKGRVIATGTNCYKKTHPLMKSYAQKAGESEKKIFKHAELSAILASGNKEIDKIFIQRFENDGSYAMAMPCKTCQRIIKDFGIRFVQFTTSEGIKEMHIDEIMEGNK